MAQHRLGKQRIQDWRRIRQAGRFNYDAIELGNVAAIAFAHDVAQCGIEIIAYGAADATTLQQHHGLVDLANQQMI